MPQFSQDFDVISKKKKKSSAFQMLIPEYHFDGPSEAHGPSAGPPETNRSLDEPPEAHGPPKLHGSWGHCPPLPPLSVTLGQSPKSFSPFDVCQGYNTAFE